MSRVAADPDPAPLWSEGVEPLALGPVVVAKRSAVDAVASDRIAPEAFLLVCIPLSDGDAAVCDPSVAATTFGAEHVAVLTARPELAALLPEGTRAARLENSVTLDVLRGYLDGLLRLEGDALTESQLQLAGDAVRALLGAVRPSSAAGLGSRRRASLYDRLVEHVDMHLRASFSVESLCAALACSRSALYRAAAPAGGVAELVQQRRLVAVRELLGDAAEGRSLAELARAHGFADATQLHRRFKAQFGLPPGQVRRRAARSAASRPQPRTPGRRAPCK